MPYSLATLHYALIMNTIKSKLLSRNGIFLPSGQFVCDFKNMSSYHIISFMYIQLTGRKHTQTWCSVAMSRSFVTLDFQTSGPCNTHIEFCAYIVVKRHILTACIARKFLFYIFVWSELMLIQHKLQPNFRTKDRSKTFF